MERNCGRRIGDGGSRKKGGVRLPRAYVQALEEVDAELHRRKCCETSRFEFATRAITGRYNTA